MCIIHTHVYTYTCIYDRCVCVGVCVGVFMFIIYLSMGAELILDLFFVFWNCFCFCCFSHFTGFLQHFCVFPVGFPAFCRKMAVVNAISWWCLERFTHLKWYSTLGNPWFFKETWQELEKSFVSPRKLKKKTLEKLWVFLRNWQYSGKSFGPL